MEYYESLIHALEEYFNRKGWRKLFLSGGCYWLADLLNRGIRDSHIMINRIEEHCAVWFDQGLYDVRGRIPAGDFHVASEREINFMRKNYIPSFDTEKLERYLEGMKLICSDGEKADVPLHMSFCAGAGIPRRSPGPPGP